MEKSSFKIFILCLIFSILIFVAVFIYALNQKDNVDIKVKYVDNPIMFFTVESCVNKYVSLIISQDKESLYNIIDEKYKKENGITVDNVLAINKHLEGNYSFVAQAMLEDENERNKYYVRGYLLEEVFESYEINNKEQYEIIIKLDVSNNTYTVIPNEVGEYFETV